MSVTMEVEAAAALDGARIGVRTSGPSDPEPPLEVIERELVACASQLFALESRFLALVAAFDRRQGWVGAGVRSCAHWLSWRCGISLHSARERVRVARALETLPAISRAFDEGRVSYSKVRAVTRVATPADEQTWLEVAESGTATHVERIAGGYRRATAPDPADDVPGFTSSDDQPEPEPEVGQVHRRYLPGGAIELTIVLSAEDAELVFRALEAAADPGSDSGSDSGSDPGSDPGLDPGPGLDLSPDVDVDRDPALEVDAGPAPTRGPSVRPRRYPEGVLAGRLARGLVNAAESFLAHGPAARQTGDRYLLAVHVDLDVLADGRDPEPFETGELSPDGIRLTGHVLRRIGCDTWLQGVLFGQGGSPLDVGRRQQVVPRRVRRALAARDRGCVFPGCMERRWVDAHHIVHWADGGPTTLANLVLLCRFHHTAVHERGFSIMLDGAVVEVRDRDGRILPSVPLLDGVASGDLSWIPRQTVPEPTCRWGGERLDLGWAVGTLCDLTRDSRPPRGGIDGEGC